MESSSTHTKQVALPLRKLALKAPWQAFVLPVSAFPIPAVEFDLRGGTDEESRASRVSLHSLRHSYQHSAQQGRTESSEKSVVSL